MDMDERLEVADLEARLNEDSALTLATEAAEEADLLSEV